MSEPGTALASDVVLANAERVEDFATMMDGVLREPVDDLRAALQKVARAYLRIVGEA